jgi:hypothetical protein
MKSNALNAEKKLNKNKVNDIQLYFYNENDLLAGIDANYARYYSKDFDEIFV